MLIVKEKTMLLDKGNRDILHSFAHALHFLDGEDFLTYDSWPPADGQIPTVHTVDVTV